MTSDSLSADKLHIIVEAEQNNIRLDRVFATAEAAANGLSRVRIQDLIKSGQCTLERNGTSKTADSPSEKVKTDDRLTLVLPPPEDSHMQAQAMPLDILYEDDALLVLNKPAGLVVHPAPGNRDATLVNALLAHCGDTLSGIGGEKRPGIVHRLDKDTGGVMVVAKTDQAHQALSAQFAAHGRDGKMQRIYQALVWGSPLPATGTIDAALARAPNNRKKIAVSKSTEARQAITHYRRLALLADNRVSLVECRLETGRTHQIRVHLAHIGHPLLGDPLYGSGMKSRAGLLSMAQQGALERLNRQALHACALGFEHPQTGDAHYYETPLPDDMQALVDALAEKPTDR